MEKINFEDATLTKQAYVIINGQTYNVVDSEYTGGTNLDANTLNYAFQLMHPVGSIYMTTIETNPKDIFGFGTWELWGAGKVPVGVDTTQTEFNEVEKTGGEKTHALSTYEMPSHAHTVQIYSHNYDQGVTIPISKTYAISFAESEAGALGFSTKEISGGEVVQSADTRLAGGDQPHNNLQPYITCYMFKRTA